MNLAFQPKVGGIYHNQGSFVTTSTILMEVTSALGIFLGFIVFAKLAPSPRRVPTVRAHGVHHLVRAVVIVGISAVLVGATLVGPSVTKSNRSFTSPTGILGWVSIPVFRHCTGCELANISVGSFPADILYDPLAGVLIVANAGSNNLSIIQSATNKVVGTVGVGGNPYGLAYDSVNGDIYVVDSGSNDVTVLNGSNFRFVATVDVGLHPQGITVDPSRGNVFVTNSGMNDGEGTGDTVSVISGATNKVTATLSVGMYPVGVAYDKLDDTIYVANRDSNNLSVISGQSLRVVRSISVQPYYLPQGVVFDPSEGAIGVFDNPICTPVQFCTNVLEVVNSSSNNVVSEVNTTPGYSYGRITYDSFDGLLATTAGNNCTFLPQDCSPSLVSFVDPGTDSYIGSLQIGQALGGLAFDPANDELYVTDWGGNVVYAIFPPRTPTHYGLDFEETGLPGGSSWSVNLQGTYGWRTQSSTDGSNTFLSINGSFMFQITAPTGYSTSPSNGTINVSGSSLVVHIKFTQNPWPMALPLVIVLVASAAIGATFVWYRKKRRHPKAHLLRVFGRP